MRKPENITNKLKPAVHSKPFKQGMNDMAAQSNMHGKELDRLCQMILNMGILVQELIRKSAKAFEKRDAEAAGEVLYQIAGVDQFESDITQMSIGLIAVGKQKLDDLRFVISAVRLSSKLKESASFAGIISQKTIAQVNQKPLINISKMAEQECNAVYSAVDSFVNNHSECRHNDITIAKDYIFLEHKLQKNMPQ